ncbi:hypothetical protein MPTK1_3g04440 [Marchantia polymorpha subsp. ruderalis]|uniref:Uncharacterized protein n=2 Tax=Marchantia polymorpha TaxID=3197 RepID=A0AAF6AXD7_MARPO|nr:hypothetical protein MARPO_0022s0087 [Marchantia polymorpha]BBN04421.1 hypothetical protein Mp_3g04440 [Marchantia polymorpha subsp. ruderalis]|eukprot:PTQ43983.1 hypothetical protein MARPO_0022s0087 [Marchantia polymorpha]
MALRSAFSPLEEDVSGLQVTDRMRMVERGGHELIIIINFFSSLPSDAPRHALADEMVPWVEVLAATAGMFNLKLHVSYALDMTGEAREAHLVSKLLIWKSELPSDQVYLILPRLKKIYLVSIMRYSTCRISSFEVVARPNTNQQLEAIGKKLSSEIEMNPWARAEICSTADLACEFMRFVSSRVLDSNRV